MRSFIKNIFISTAVGIALLGGAVTVFAAGNIDSVKKYSQFINTDINEDLVQDLINWSPTEGGATVSDTAITGYIWGETVGWINLNPSGSGVINTCSGVLSGYAWGHNAGWINFNPTNATIAPNINTSTGEITGQVWSQNYGWIELASTETGFLGLNTSWRPSSDCTNPPPPPSGGQSHVLKVNKQVVGGPAVPSDFIISVKESGINVGGSPFAGSVQGASVIITTEKAKTFVITEQSSSDYVATFSGDCAPYGVVSFDQADPVFTKTCTIINTYQKIDEQGKIYTCKDPAALNYDANPNTFAKNSLCKYKILDDQNNLYACKDPAALNYNLDPKLLENNNLCTYKKISEENLGDRYGCKDSQALNYNADPKVLGNNSLCSYQEDGFACKDERADNYDADASLKSDSSRCIYPREMYTCKDPFALNFNADTTAPTDNTLCQYPRPESRNRELTLLVLTLLGLASTIPGLTTRAGNMVSTFVFGRKKVRGVVYDSKNKEPLDPVYVSVIDLTTNQEVKNQVTDIEGRFGFVLKKGHYKITAGKTHYQFPSILLAGRASDEVYDRLYFGESFTVENEEQVVTVNIPMDPTGDDWNQQEKHRMNLLQYLIKGQTKYIWIFNALFAIGFLASIMITYFYPTWWNYVMTGLYVVLGLVQVYGRGPVYAGKITKNGVPLAGAIVHIWNANLNHEVAKKVTETSGAYYAIVPKADYYVTIDQKNPDGTFTNIFTSNVFHANHGCIDKKFDI